MAPPDIYRDLDAAGRAFEEPVITIGNFDGVHLGHRALFRRTRELGRSLKSPTLAVTFRPHPVRFFKSEVPDFRLTPDREKCRLIGESGLDGVLLLEFDRDIAELSPNDFVDSILARGLDASCVVVGANFAFGKGRAGTTEDLTRLAGERGIDTEIYPELEWDGEPISSTRIRECLRAGDVYRAARLLGRQYRLFGTVVEGEKRGRELGYPTANLDTEHLVPAHGVYATLLHDEHRWSEGRPAATSIGVRPVFDEPQETVESYVLDADDSLDLYGERVAIEFAERLREERDFDSVEELVAQMDRDVESVRRHFRLGDRPSTVSD
jgi:riboflavin kinase/FMN adenylyltransferase